MATDAPHEWVIGARVGVLTRLRRLWQYRELLVGMVRKELKVKYKNSVLGFAWSLINPLLYLAVFYVAFQVILGAGIPSFPIFLLSGLLVWNLFSTGLSAATDSIVSNAGIVTKVYFPREVLPLASIGAALVHFVLQSTVLFAVLAVVRWNVAWAYLPLLPVALLVLLVLASGMGLLLGAVNVYLRDTQHLLELALLAWFWLTPVVYAFELLEGRARWARVLFMANPITPIVVFFQRAIYDTVTVAQSGPADPGAPQSLQRLASVTHVLPEWSMGGYLAYLGYAAAVAIVMLVLGLWVFGRLEASLAEEL